LLVTVSIGVGFAITRTFGVTWTWIHFGDGTWAFDKKAFLQEMLPLMVMVPVLSVVAYFLITGAVRKYRAYLDSGQDYKNLVKSIRQIDDLEEDRIKSLGDYPELRSFLLKIRKRITEREKALDERDASIAVRKGDDSATEQLRAESGVLIGAINKGPQEGFDGDLALSIPEMKQLERAIRQNLLGNLSEPVSMSANTLGEKIDDLREEIGDSTAGLKRMIGELSKELLTNQNGAREIELYLSQLKVSVNSGGGGEAGQAAGNAAAVALVDRLDQTSAALAGLGEETKSVAINTALQAGGGQGGVTELVKLADDVRDLAAKFNGISGQYQEVGRQVRATVQAVPAGADDGQFLDIIDTVSDRVTFWVERAVIIGQKMGAFEQHLLEVTAGIEAKLGVEDVEETYQALDDDLTGSTPGAPVDEAPPKAVASHAVDEHNAESQDGDSVHTGLTGVFERDELHPTAPAPVERAGAVGERNLFEEIGGSSEDNLFADIPEEAQAAENAQEPAQPPIPPIEPSAAATPPLAPAPGQAHSEPGELVQAQMDLSGSEKKETAVPGVDQTAAPQVPDVAPPADFETHRAAAPAQPAAPQTDNALAADPPPAQKEKEELVYDLYELGAVDYEPSVHHSV